MAWSSSSRRTRECSIREPQTVKVHPGPLGRGAGGALPAGVLRRRRHRGAQAPQLRAAAAPRYSARRTTSSSWSCADGAAARPAGAIVAAETVREADGLAMSSRNAYLSAAERAEAPRLYRTLREVAAGRLGRGRGLQTLAGAGWKPDYVEVRRRADLAPPQAGDRRAGRAGGRPPGTDPPDRQPGVLDLRF